LPCRSCQERGKQCGRNEKTYGRVGEEKSRDGVMDEGPDGVAPTLTDFEDVREEEVDSASKSVGRTPGDQNEEGAFTF
jgi:hypothetical protein